MKQNRIRIVQELLITQINFIVFYPFCLTIATIFNDIIPAERARLSVWMLGGLVFFAMYFIRIYAKNFIVLALLHGICLGMMILLGQILSPRNSASNSTFFVIVGVGFVIYSIYLRLQTEDF